MNQNHAVHARTLDAAVVLAEHVVGERAAVRLVVLVKVLFRDSNLLRAARAQRKVEEAVLREGGVRLVGAARALAHKVLGLEELHAALLAALEEVDIRHGDLAVRLDRADRAQRHAAVADGREDGVGHAAVRQQAKDREEARAKVAVAALHVGQAKRRQVDAQRSLEQLIDVVAGERAFRVVRENSGGQVLARGLDEALAAAADAKVPLGRERVGVGVQRANGLEREGAAGKAGGGGGIERVGLRAAHLGGGEHHLQKNAKHVDVGSRAFGDGGQLGKERTATLVVIAQLGASASRAHRPQLASLAVDHLVVRHEALVAVARSHVGVSQNHGDPLIFNDQIANGKG